MKSILVAATLFAASAAHADVYFDMAVGYNSVNKNSTMLGPKDTARFTLQYVPWNERGWFISYTHVSHTSAGPPFNKKPEGWIDTWEIGYRTNLTKLFGRRP